MKNIIPFVTLLFATVIGASPLPDFPFVHVHGSAEKKVEPNIATIRFDMLTYHSDPKAAEEALSSVAATIYEQISNLKIPDENAFAGTTQKTVARSEDEFGNDLDIIGYEFERSVTIKLDDLSVYPEMIEFLYKLDGVENINVTFDRSDREPLLQDLVTEASSDAREKADRLAKGFGSRIKSIKAISESEFSGIFGEYGLPEGTTHRYGARSIGGRDFRVIPATISIRKGIYAIFEIE